MDYCSEGRIQHSTFLEWPEEDQEKAIVWLSEQRLKCPDCGTRRDESDPTKGGHLHAYHVEKFTCYVCQNIEQEYADSRIKGGKRKGMLPYGFKMRAIPNYVWTERKRVRRQREILDERKDAIKKAQERREINEKARSPRHG